MNQIIDQLVKMMKSGNYDIVTIAETNHFSVSSHTFHYNFLIKLIEHNLINTISSECLTNIDVLLIQLYLEGKIKCTLKDLYKKYLPLGGMGTYRWIEYIKEHKLNIRIIPSERDQFYEQTFKYKPNLIKTLNNITTLNLNQDHFFQYDNLTTLNPTTELDKLVYQYIKDSFEVNRMSYWFNNLSKHTKEDTKLFINGFHLDRDTNVKHTIQLSKLGKTLHLGMASADIRVLFDNNKILNLSDYYGLTDLEKQFKGKYAIIDCDKISGTFKTNGIGVLPLVGNLEDVTFSTNIYDFVVWIPKSDFLYKLYY